MPQPKVYIYEEYNSPKAKRTAQKGATRGQPTGKGRGFIFVFDRWATYYSAGVRCVEGVASVFRLDPGEQVVFRQCGGYPGAGQFELLGRPQPLLPL